MNFGDLQQRLVDRIRETVRRGELTERGLARLTGVSQPHIHHILKGKRVLSPSVADAVLHQLDLDLIDLIEPNELFQWRLRHDVPRYPSV